MTDQTPDNPEIVDSIEERTIMESSAGYVPVQMRGQGFKDAVLEHLDYLEGRLLDHPRAEAMTDQAIKEAMDAAGLGGIKRAVASRVLDWLLPSYLGRILFKGVRALVVRL